MDQDNKRDDDTWTYIPPMKDTMVGHYRIVEKIGAGGMGEVYLAEDTQLERKVALKFLPQHLYGDEECRARFKREAQAAAKLNHSNIVTVYEVGEYKGRPFFAMEYVEGQPLKDFIGQNGITIDFAVEVVLQLCEGLEKAHRECIIHRDIKPSNIIIDADGRACLLDFGLATVQRDEKLTKTGSTLGTVGYMSPEQIKGKGVDRRSDLFSLGIVLYEMIAGRRPFEGESETATFNAIINDKQEPLARYKSGVPEGLQKIVTKLLEKEPGYRYQTAAGVVPDLKKLITEGALLSKPVDWWNRYVVAGAVVILLIIAGYWLVTEYITGQPKSTETELKMLAVLPFENLGDPDDEYFADGITRDVSSRLASIPNLGVIAHASAATYKKTDKSLDQIADELGVAYILDGSVQWDKSGDTDLVRVAPQLINVTDQTQMWANNYERRITGIFAVQSSIASEISTALGIALSKDERELVHAAPTNSLEAYNAFLKARELYWMPDVNKSEMVRIVGLLEHSIELDSTFVSAHALLSMAHGGFYHYGIDHTDDRLVLSLEAAQNALDIDPKSPEGHLAMAWYHYRAHRDYNAALTELTAAEAAGIGEYYSSRLAATIHKRRGDFEKAIQCNQRALKYNPRDPDVLHEMSVCYKWLSRHQEAIDLCKKMIELAPDQHMGYLYAAEYSYSLEDGLSKARKILEKMPGELSDLDHGYWILQEFCERDTSALFKRLGLTESITVRGPDGVFTNKLINGWVHQYLGKPSKAKPYLAEARDELKSQRSENPDDELLLISLSFASAGLGLLEESIAYSDSSILAFPVERDLLDGILVLNYRVRVCAAIGRHDKAIDIIERILSGPSPWTIKEYILDPRIDPLRDHPRFKALIDKYDTK